MQNTASKQANCFQEWEDAFMARVLINQVSRNISKTLQNHPKKNAVLLKLEEVKEIIKC